jgi:hypothetical protein
MDTRLRHVALHPDGEHIVGVQKDLGAVKAKVFRAEP